MILGDMEDLKMGPNIILGEALAYDLNVVPGESVKLLILTNLILLLASQE